MIRKSIKEVIKEYFLANPSARVRVRGLERILNLPLPSIIRYCKELKEENILIIELIGNVCFYKASKNEKYVLEKKLYNLKKIYESGLIDYLKQELSNPLIIIFGSYSKGEDTEDSDIDLFIESPSKKTISVEKFRKLFGKNIQTFISKSIKEIPNKHLANNILNGITLNGELEVFK